MSVNNSWVGWYDNLLLWSPRRLLRLRCSLPSFDLAVELLAPVSFHEVDSEADNPSEAHNTTAYTACDDRRLGFVPL